jgi:hypothetical protein
VVLDLTFALRTRWTAAANVKSTTLANYIVGAERQILSTSRFAAIGHVTPGGRLEIVARSADFG